jgi:ankyrin repeat protein
MYSREENYFYLIRSICLKSSSDYVQHAAKNDFPQIVRYLLDQGSTDVNEALIKACEGGSEEIVRLLIEKGADVHFKGETSLEQASIRGSLKLVQLLLEAGADPSNDEYLPLNLAARNGHTHIVRIFLDRFPRVNLGQLCTEAITNDHLETLKFLQSRGAELVSFHGGQLLEMAAYLNHLEMTRYLLDQGVRVAQRVFVYPPKLGSASQLLAEYS